MIAKEDVQILIAGGEKIEIEFKGDIRRPLSDTELVDAVVCLANAQGGIVLIGVEDDGQITGLHRTHLSSGSGHLAALVSSRTMPPLPVEVSIIAFPEGSVAAVEVPRSPELTATSDGRLTTRYLEMSGKPGCRPLYPHELAGRAANRGQLDVTDQIVMGTTWDDLDPLEFVRFRRLIGENRGDVSLLNLDDMALARALRWIRPFGEQSIPTLAGLLLVGREQVIRDFIPAHEVAFQVLRGSDARVIVNEFYQWPLFRLFERILEMLEVRNEEQEINVGLSRIGIPSYDRQAFREAVNNAFVHRDYTRLGAIHIQFRDNGVEVRSPGGFIEGIRPDNLLVAGPQPRNPRLADIFKRTGLVERTGRGVNLIYTGQLRAGRLPPDYTRSTPMLVSVVMPGGITDIEFVRILITEEKRRKQPFTLDELLLLNHLHHERELDASSAGRLIQKGEAEGRRQLELLVESGLVENHGVARTRRYFFSATTYGQMGKSEEYIRRRGLETMRMEQLTLQLATKQKRITRRQVMELCHVNASQAYYLINKLTRRGLLQHMGIGGRSSYYMPTHDVPNIDKPEARSKKQEKKLEILSDEMPSEQIWNQEGLDL